MRSDKERLLDIQEAIIRIEKYAAQGQSVFEEDELIQTWIVHHLQIIGEACRALSAEVQAQAPHIPWSNIVGMRNILVHAYFGIDTGIVWSVVETNLPQLKEAVEGLLSIIDN